MNIEDSIKTLKEFNKIKINSYAMQFVNISYPKLQQAIETLLTAYEKEKEKNKKAIDFINERKKIVNKDMAEGTKLQVGTFMWQVDELLEILKEK